MDSDIDSRSLKRRKIPLRDLLDAFFIMAFGIDVRFCIRNFGNNPNHSLERWKEDFDLLLNAIKIIPKNSKDYFLSLYDIWCQ